MIGILFTSEDYVTIRTDLLFVLRDELLQAIDYKDPKAALSYFRQTVWNFLFRIPENRQFEVSQVFPAGFEPWKNKFIEMIKEFIDFFNGPDVQVEFNHDYSRVRKLNSYGKSLKLSGNLKGRGLL